MAAPPLFHPGKELPILWEGAHLVIIDKPAGLAVHPGPQGRDNVESRLLPQKRGGPWLVHRLDADTAGCLLIARRKSALIAAQKAFARRGVEKRYWALVHGRPENGTGTLTTMLRRISTSEQGWKMLSEAPASSSGQISARKSPQLALQASPEQTLHTPPPSPRKTGHALQKKGRKAKGKKGGKGRGGPIHPQSAETGKLARTSWQLLASNGTASLLELTLHTGRTHQARVHCAALGTPIIGDPLYGPDRAGSGKDEAIPGIIPGERLYLLAQSLSLTLDEDEPTAHPSPPTPSSSRDGSAHAEAAFPHPERQKKQEKSGAAHGKAPQNKTSPHRIAATATHPVMARFLAEHPVKT